jgi:cytochrome c553
VHGEGGASGAPRLAGQNAEYMIRAMSTFKDETRASAIMQPIARMLVDTQIRELADYFSGQDAPLAAALSSSQSITAGKRLVETGTSKIAACFSCHGAQGQGVGARYPRIAGQPAQFVIDRLHEFQARARGKTVAPRSMTGISTMLDEQEIGQAAAYLSQLKP